jgi:hypothetical protein
VSDSHDKENEEENEGATEILTSIPATHVQMRVSELLLDKSHFGKYIVGTLKLPPYKLRGALYFTINPENDSCKSLNVELKFFYLYIETDQSIMERQEIGKESGLYVGRRVCLLNPNYYKSKDLRLEFVSAAMFDVIFL